MDCDDGSDEQVTTELGCDVIHCTLQDKMEHFDGIFFIPDQVDGKEFNPAKAFDVSPLYYICWHQN